MSGARFPVVTVYCDDAVHADAGPHVVARFAKYPPGVFPSIEGWQMLSDEYEDQFNDTSGDHRRRFVDEIVTIGGSLRYNLRCPRCNRRNHKSPLCVPVGSDLLQLVCDELVARVSPPTLAEFGASVVRSAGRIT